MIFYETWRDIIIQQSNNGGGGAIIQQSGVRTIIPQWVEGIIMQKLR